MEGTYHHSLDAKGRVFVPAALRDELGDMFRVTLIRGEEYLTAFPDDTWNRMTEQIRSLTKGEQKALRSISANARRCELDQQGRILLPKELRDLAGLRKNIAVVGNFGCVEFWDDEVWAKSGDADGADEEFLSAYNKLTF
ncbi:MAG: division/cell wall cluster transcriptional repressor MraZ [Oscillospiraceae bacterium]|jgi:MraZ protein|nr:division/cell wall cluster transcriptional repressor MraZ [Oscillospiraceae bacterium]